MNNVAALLDVAKLITPERAVPVFSRETVAFLLTQGHLLVIHRDLVYRLNRFLPRHPGGVLPVLHYIGRDATDEIEAYHPVFALKQMRHYVVARVEIDPVVGWNPLLPPLHVGWPGEAEAYEHVPSIANSLLLMSKYAKSGYPTREALVVPPVGVKATRGLSSGDIEPPPPDVDRVEQHRLTLSFRKLRQDMLKEDNMFECRPLELYRNTLLRCGALFCVFLFSYLYATSKWHLGVSAAALGFFMHQIMFCAHDAGHTEITGDRFWDRAIGGIIASYASGMSLGWWISQHDVHHLVPNHPEHDPDIQLLPTFAFNVRFFDSLYSTFHKCTMHFDAAARFFVTYQHLVFYPIMVVARFSLFGKSYHYLTMKAPADGFRTFEIAGVFVFWAWYTTLLKNLGGHGLELWVTGTLYSLVVLVCVCPIHVQIVLSHSAQDSNDLGVHESFVHRQMRTTMDVACPAYLDFVHGGLQMQVSHHLFPRLPRPNLRRATVLVKAWAAENNITFLEKSFTAGNAQMVGMLADISGQYRALKATANDLARGKIEFE